MRLDDKLNDMFDEIEVPVELLPQNIASMLKAKTEQSKMEAEHKDIKSAGNINTLRRTIIMRTAAATAACAVFAVGMLAYNKTDPDSQKIDPRVNFEAITPQDYDDLRNFYTGISIDSSEANGTETDIGTAKSENTTTAPANPKAETAPAITSNSVITTVLTEELSADDIADFDDDRVSNADIVKSDGVNLYCISDGVLYVINIETMEVVEEIKHSLNPPVELYIDGDTLILISKADDEVQVIDTNSFPEDTENYEYADSVPADDADTDYSDNEITNSFITENSDNDSSQASAQDVSNTAEPSFSNGDAYPVKKDAVTQSNVIVDFYDISDKTSLRLTTSYIQNGSYISSRIVDGVIYTTTLYSDYRSGPLDMQADLDSFVPCYYLDGEKRYVEASDIIIPSNANSTDYTVVSAIDCKSPEDISVKAVLGSSKNVCCSADSIYIVGIGKKDTDYSIITSFSLSKNNGGLTYRAVGSVDGAVIGQHSMNFHDGMFRIATKTTDNSGTPSVSLYVLDDMLNVVKSAGQLLSGQNVTNVRFDENYAFVFTDSKSKPEIVIDLSTAPPVQTQAIVGQSACLYKYSSSELLGLSVIPDENGSAAGLTLSMYDSESGLLINSIDLANNLNDFNSKVLNSRRALFIDKRNSLIGIPVYGHNQFGTVNQYHVFSYNNASGFILKGVIEYNDIDDSQLFERAVVNNDILYIIGNKRIVSARLSDMKVIDSFSY